MLTVSVLGPVEVRRYGHPVPVRPGKTTELLVRLALDAGVTVRAERLIEELWGEAAPTTTRNTLQTKVSRLRKELGDPGLLTGDASGYTLHVEPTAVDALEVRRVAAATRARLDAGDAVAVAQLAAEALTSYRGEVLPDAGDGDWATPVRTQLDEIRLQLVEDLLAARLELGAAGEVTGDLEALVGAHPMRERAWALLVTALYRDGRQADALAAYTRVRAVLAEELGLEPGPELRALEQRVLDQDPGLARARRVTPGNLPALSAPIVGRGPDVAALVPRLETARLVTLVGPAGVGKTRLAVEVARRCTRTAGTWLVRLEVASSPTEVVEAIAAALQIADGAEAALLDRLRGAELQLVLDNCEHVVDAVADLVPRLLDVAPGVGVLCTSQVPLGLPGESVYELAPLGADDSIALFTQRAVEQRRSFTVDAADAATVREVCDALDGLPLAIELAAARAKTLSVAEIARRLDDRFALLRDASTRRPARQRALATAIDWSYELLFPDDQRGLWALACFTGDASLAAVESVLVALDVPAAAALDVIGRLVDRSLVTVEVAGGGDLRYRLLDSVRAFARDRMHEAGAAPAGFRAHAEWFAAAADAARSGIRGPAQSATLIALREERANVDGALAWAGRHDSTLALRIVNGFGWAWVVVGDGELAAGRLRAALDAAGADASGAARAEAWADVAWLTAGNDVADARAAAETAVAIAAETGDDAQTAWAELARAYVLVQAGRGDEAIEILRRCRTSFGALGRGWEEGSTCVLTVHAALVAGDAELAAAACADAERIVRPLGDDWGVGHLEAILGRVAMAEGRLDAATVHLRGAADAAARLGFATSEGYHLVNLASVLHDAGDDDEAMRVLDRAVDIGTVTAELRLSALARTHLGRIRLAHGDRDGARDALAAADAFFRASGGGDAADLAALLLAEVSQRQGAGD